MRRRFVRGIPTAYAGVRFRSRLEARVAAFFDQLSLSWDYEPSLDLAGWIPDFYVPAWSALVECKPALRTQDMLPAQTKAEASGYVGTVIVLGARWVKEQGQPLALAAELTGLACTHAWVPATLGLPQAPMPEFAWKIAGNSIQWRKRRSR